MTRGLSGLPSEACWPALLPSIMHVGVELIKVITLTADAQPGQDKLAMETQDISSMP